MSAEQKARDMLERMGVQNAQSMTAGDLVEMANLIADASRPPIMTDAELLTAADASGIAMLEEQDGRAVLISCWKEDADMTEIVRRFAALVQAAERERCAQVCEEDAFVDQWRGLAEAARRIRARGATPPTPSE